MRLYRILKKPVQSEKTELAKINNTYVFIVSRDATKIDIKKAVLDIYGVEVSNVNILNTREKFKNGKKGPQLRKRSTKKAYVTLKDQNTKIDYSIVK